MGHLIATEQSALTAFTERVRQELSGRVSSILLFGSKARGDAQPDSDIDVLVILEQGNWHDTQKIVDIASAILIQTGADISPKVMTKTALAEKRQRKNVFMQLVDRDAIEV